MKMNEEFLLDEVRCGFLVPAAMKQSWAADLEVLREIDRICKKHHIMYFADWGTLLGAVRHGGFIPWDDDLDIVMKRADYETFKEVIKEEFEGDFELLTYENYPDNWLFMGKVVGNRRACFEKEHLRKFHNFPYVASVDIFVLDYVNRDERKEEERCKRCTALLAVADDIIAQKESAKKIEQELKAVENLCQREFQRLNDPIEMGRYLYREIEKMFAEVKQEDADILTQLFPWGLKQQGFRFPKNYYEKAVELPFEFTTIPVPYAYNEMLSRRYGDYLRLNKTSGAHDYPFFEVQKQNLQAVLDFSLPEFQIEPERLTRSMEKIGEQESSTFKQMLLDCLSELETLLEKRLLPESQQLAVDLGGFIENTKGEGSSSVGMLEAYCEKLYETYEAVNNKMPETDILWQELRLLLGKTSSTIKVEFLDRETVFFFPVHSREWNSIAPFWEECMNNPQMDVYVIPLPYYFKDYDGSAQAVCYEGNDYPENVTIFDYPALTEEFLALIHPEKIYIQNPYDEWNPNISLPKMFYTEKLRKNTDELIYVCPFVRDDFSVKNAREYTNLKYYAATPGVCYADTVYVESDGIRDTTIDYLTQLGGELSKEIWEKRICVRPYTNAEEKSRKDKKKILYGISLGAYLENPMNYQEKIRCNREIFAENSAKIEVDVLIYPENTADFAEEQKELAEKLKEYSLHKVNLGTIVCTDYAGYYGNPMPVVSDFRCAKVPCMIQKI